MAALRSVGIALVAIAIICGAILVFISFSDSDDSSTSEQSSSDTGSYVTPADLYTIDEARKSYDADRVLKTFNYCGTSIDPVEQRQFAITFNDGPDIQATPDILADLNTAGVPATFFVTPNLERGTPSTTKCVLIREILAAGHSVQSHTWSNEAYTDMSDDEIALDLYATRQWIEECAGDQSSKLNLFAMRPLSGELSLDGLQARFISKADEYTVAGWNVDPKDSSTDGITVAEAMQNIASDVATYAPDNGSIVIPLHDRVYTDDGTKGLIQEIVDEYSSLDYTFVTVDECYSTCDRDICEDSEAWPRYYLP